MGSLERSSTSSPLLEGSAGEFAEARTSEQMKEIMEQMMELKRRCCSAEDKCASMEEKFISMENKCTSMAEEVRILGAQNKILIEKLVESYKCLSDLTRKNLESHHLISHPDPYVTPKSPPMRTLHVRLRKRHSETQENKIIQRPCPSHRPCSKAHQKSLIT